MHRDSMKIKAVEHSREYQNGTVLMYNQMDTTNEEGWKIYINGKKYPIGKGTFYPLILTEEGREEAIKRATRQHEELLIEIDEEVK